MNNTSDETLSEFVLRVMKEGRLSYRDIEKRSEFGITGSYVNQITNNLISQDRLSVKALKALAKGLNTSEEIIFSVARQSLVNPMEVNLERFERIGMAFSRVPPGDMVVAKFLVDLLEREINRMSVGGQTPESKVSVSGFMENETFGTVVMWKRKQARITQGQLAEASGISKSYVSTIENGIPHSLTGAISQPARDVVLSLVDALNRHLQPIDRIDRNQALLLAGYAPLTKERGS